MAIKFLRELRKTKVGIDREDINLLKETHLELSVNQDNVGVLNQRIGEHLSTQSHAENHENVSESENTVPTNESINMIESEESVTEYGNTVPPNKMTKENLGSLSITENDKTENILQKVETIIQYKSSSEVIENNKSVKDIEDVNNTAQGN